MAEKEMFTGYTKLLMEKFEKPNMRSFIVKRTISV